MKWYVLGFLWFVFLGIVAEAWRSYDIMNAYANDVAREYSPAQQEIVRRLQQDVMQGKRPNEAATSLASELGSSVISARESATGLQKKALNITVYGAIVMIGITALIATIRSGSTG